MKKNTLLLAISALMALLMISCPLPAPMDPSSDIILMLPPPPPSGVKATNWLNDSIEVSWEEVEGADGYIVMMMDADDFKNGSSSGSDSSGKDQGGLTVLRERGFHQVGECDKSQLSLKITGDTVQPGRHYVYSVVAYRNFGAIQKFSDRSAFFEGGTMGKISSINRSVDPTSVHISWDVPAMKSVLHYVNGMPRSLYPYCSFVVSFREVKPNATEVRCAEVREGAPLLAKIPVRGTDLDGNSYELMPSIRADKDDKDSRDQIVKYSFWVTMYVYEDAGHSGNPIGISPKSEEVTVEILPTVEAPAVEDLRMNEAPLADRTELTWYEPLIVGIDGWRPLYRIERQSEGSAGWTTLLSEFDAQDSVSMDDSGKCTWKDMEAPVNENVKYRVAFGYAYPSGDPKEPEYIVMQGTGIEETVFQHRIWVPTDPVVTSFDRGEAGEDSLEATVTLQWKFPGGDEDLRKAEWQIIIDRWSAEHIGGEEGYDKEPQIIKPVLHKVAENTYETEFTVHTDSSEYQQMYYFRLAYTNGDADVKIESGMGDGVVPQLGGFRIKPLFEDLHASSNRLGEVKLTWKDINPEGYERSYVFKIGDTLIEDLPEEMFGYDEASGLMSAILKVGIDLPEDLSSWDMRMSVYDGVKQDPDQPSDPNQGPVRQYTNLIPVTGSLLVIPEIQATQGESSTQIDVTVTNAAAEDKEVEYGIFWAPKGSEDDAFRELPKSDAGWVLPAGEGNNGEVIEFRARARNTDQTEEIWTEYSEKAEGAVFGGAGIEITASQGTDPKNIELSFTPAMGADHYIIRRKTVLPEGKAAEWYAGEGGPAPEGEWGEVIKSDLAKTSYRDNIADYDISVDMEGIIPLSDRYEYMVIPVKADGTEADIGTCIGNTVTGWLFMPPREICATKGWAAAGEKDSTKITLSWSAVGEATAYAIQTYTFETVTEKGDDGETVTRLRPVVDGNVKILTNEELGEPVDGKYSYTMKGNVEGRFYAIRSLNSGTGLESAFQTKFLSDHDEVGTSIPSNFGYAFDTAVVQDFIAETAPHGTDPYRDWIQLSWKRTRGATVYELRLKESEDTIVIDVSALEVDLGNLQPVEKAGKPNSPGFLSYDRESDTFTYYDRSGIMKDRPFISNYTIRALNRMGLKTESKDNLGDGRLYRQLKPEEYVNVMNNLLCTYLDEANRSFNKDWFRGSASALLGGESSSASYRKDGVVIEVTSTSETTLNHDTNNMKMDRVKDPASGFEFTTPSYLAYDYADSDGGAGYLGYDKLQLIGVKMDGEGSSGKGQRIVMEDPAGNYRTCTIDLLNVTPYNYNGTYDVNIDGGESKTITHSKDLSRPFTGEGL